MMPIFIVNDRNADMITIIFTDFLRPFVSLAMHADNISVQQARESVRNIPCSMV